MTPEFDFFGLYFSSIVPRFILCLALWMPLQGLFAALGMHHWIRFPALFNLSAFLILIAAITFLWHP
jgi:hypothetical protein